jgi:hypothetical protein
VSNTSQDTLLGSAQAAGYQSASDASICGLLKLSLLGFIAENISPTPPANGLLNGLTAYWELTEPSGSRADSIGSMTLTDTYGSIFGGPAGASFDLGSADFPNGILQPTTYDGVPMDANFSFSIWYQVSQDASPADYPFMTLIQMLDNPITSNLLLLWVNPDHSMSLYSSSGDGASDVHIVEDVMFDVNTYQNIIFTADETNLTVYVNGVMVNQFSRLYGPAVGLMSIGNSIQFMDKQWIGIIDQTGWWNRALSETDIANLYNSGVPLTFSQLTP